MKTTDDLGKPARQCDECGGIDTEEMIRLSVQPWIQEDDTDICPLCKGEQRQ